MKIYLEIFFVCAESHECIQYCKIHIDITDDICNPDEIVFKSVKQPSDLIPLVCGDQFISHSTSWRYEYDSSIYLTYLIYSEHIDFRNVKSKTLSLKDMVITHGSAPDRPRPPNIMEEHILSHGMCHLSYLVRHSPGGMFKNIIRSKSKLLFSQIAPVLAGKIN